MKSNISANSYTTKSSVYFDGIRADYVAYMPVDPLASILELGCAHGKTGLLALSEGKCGRYIGIEIDPEAANIARKHLTEVITGNVETMDLPWPEASFGVLIISEVLEHLVDPWKTVERLSKLIRPGGKVFASSPNISHYSVILRLIQGRWELTDCGTMDRTHLRWFTPRLYQSLFEENGFQIDTITPVTPFSWRTRIINRLTGQRIKHLLMRQISVSGTKC